MSKRLPKQRQPRHQSKPSKTIPSSSTTELDPKMLNISAGGQFYERAKSRRNRHREVFASTKAGRAITDEAVPLGSKGKSGSEKGTNHVRDALARFKSEKGSGKRNRSATEERTVSSRGNREEFESKSSDRRVNIGGDESKRKSTSVTVANDHRISNDKNNTSFRGEIIDLTD